MNAAVQVYLDSSAYSNLSAGGRFHDLLPDLTRLRDSGLAQFRFSIVHILEAVATDRQYLSASASRLDVMRQICGPFCLIDPYKIWRLETTSRPTRSRIHRNDGWWLPIDQEVEIDFPDPKKIVEDELQKSDLNRKARRQLAALLFTKTGKLTPRAMEMALSGAGDFATSLSEKYPLSPEVRVLAIQASVGRIPVAMFMQRLKSSLAGLNEFHNWYDLKWEEMAPCFAWLRKRGNALVELLHDSRALLQELRERSSRRGISEERLDQLNIENSRRAEVQILERVVAHLRSEVSDASDGAGTWEQSPGMRSNLSLAWFNFMRTILPVRGARGAKESDFGDTLHATYLPYVDVFHTDAHAASHLKNVAPRFGTQVFSRLEDLFTIVENFGGKAG